MTKTTFGWLFLLWPGESMAPLYVWNNQHKRSLAPAAMKFSDSVTLQGRYASLVPLTMAHQDGLCEAVMDGELWKLWYTSIPSPEAMANEIDRRLGLQKLGFMNPFCVLDAKGSPIGMTNYMNIDQENRRLEIGPTWYRKSVQRTAVNTECKLMLLRHAFKKLDCIAVELRAHFLNHQSRKGIERLGAKLDGVLRSHQINLHPDAKGNIRDTCVYSILVGEFPSVETHLTFQLQI
jgi:RimJ/RimL family protein N-acetyltransferase